MGYVVQKRDDIILFFVLEPARREKVDGVVSLVVQLGAERDVSVV